MARTLNPQLTASERKQLEQLTSTAAAARERRHVDRYRYHKAAAAVWRKIDADVGERVACCVWPVVGSSDLVAKFGIEVEARHGRQRDRISWWLVSGFVVNRRSGLSLSSLVIEPRSDAGPQELSAEVVRAVKAPLILRTVRAHLRHRPELQQLAERFGLTPRLDDAEYEELLSRAEAADRPRKVGRPGYPDDWYRYVGKVAMDVAREGVEAPLDEIARRLPSEIPRRGRRPITRSNVRDWLHEARERGILARPVTPRGVFEAAPGPKFKPSPHAAS